MTSSPIKFSWNLNINRPRVYLSDIPNFILIVHKRAEIQSREVNRELWRKNGYYVTVIWPLTQGHQFQLVLSQCGKLLFSENRVQIGSSVRLEFCSQEFSWTHRQTDRHTHTHTQSNCSENITPPWFRGGVKIIGQILGVDIPIIFARWLIIGISSFQVMRFMMNYVEMSVFS